MKKTILLILFFVCFQHGFSQQDPMFSQYMFNILSINPAYAGSRGALSAVMLSRYQWVGLDGAPVTHTVSAHAPIMRGNMGIGGTIVQDKIGPVKQTFGYIDISYLHKVSANGTLSFGMKAGVSGYQVDFRSLENVNLAVDNGLNDGLNQNTTPNIGAGVFYYTHTFYAGISAPRLATYAVETGEEISAVQPKYYFGEIGLVTDISYALKIKPTLLVRYTKNEPVSYHVTADFIVHEKMWLGGTYRLREGIGTILQFQFNHELRAGYAFDYPLTSINKSNGFLGSHELMIGFDFISKEKERFHSPRYF